MSIDTARALLGLPDDSKIEIVIEWDSNEFAGSLCCEGNIDHPGVAHVDWWTISYHPDTDAPRWGGLEQLAFCLDHARKALAEIVEELAPFEWWDSDDYLSLPHGAEPGDPLIKVTVSGAALSIGLQATA